MTHTYTVKHLDGEIGNIIAAPLYLAEKECPREKSTLELGEYIWARKYVRAHFRKNIELVGNVTKVLAEFICDNTIEIFVNGKKAYDSSEYFGHGEKVMTGVLELTDFFSEGVNRIAIRAYQSGTYTRFISAMRGAFAVYEGEKETLIKTDESFMCAEVANYWQDKEDEGWELTDEPRSFEKCEVFPIHPHALRRSAYFKKEFRVGKNLKKAVLRATSYGLYTPYVNGKRISDEKFLPGAMEECKEYREFDITESLVCGENAVGAVSGNGWYNCREYAILSFKRHGFAAEIHLDYGDRYEIIPTDESWMCALSPYYEDDLQFGERYDARLEIPDWCVAGSGSSKFVPAEIIGIEHREYVLQEYPPIRVIKTLLPKNRRVLGNNRVMFDFGTNGAGRSKMTIKNTKRGEMFRVRYAERLTENGEPAVGVYTDVYYPSDTFPGGEADATLKNCDCYICKGADSEVYEPEFTYTGFRYIYVEYPQGYNSENIEVEAKIISNDLKTCGEITTSYEPIMGLWGMITRSFRSNSVGGPTDCPTREKNFWNGDIQAFCYTAMWYADVNDYLSRWTHMGRKIQRDIYGWEDEEYILPYKLYKFYGNTDILKAKYETIMSLIEKRERDYEKDGFIQERSPYRDHLAVKNVDFEFFSYCWHTYMYRIAAEISEVISKEENAEILYKKYNEWRDEFNAKYYLSEEHDYSERCQGGIILPVMLGLAPESDIASLAERLVEYIKCDNGLTTGFFTTEYLLLILSEYGYHDIACDLITKDTYPSWLYLLKTGSTTITESWKGEAARFDGSMNHYSLGSVGRYFFEALGGLKNHTADMRHFDIKPVICKKLGDFGVSYKTEFGKVSVYWRVSDENFAEVKINIPIGVSADVTLPNGKTDFISGEEKTYSFEI